MTENMLIHQLSEEMVVNIDLYVLQSGVSLIFCEKKY